MGNFSKVCKARQASLLIHKVCDCPFNKLGTEAQREVSVIGSCGAGLGPHLVTSEAVLMSCGHGLYQLQLAFAKSRQG